MLKAVADGGGQRAATTKALFGLTDHERHPRQLHDQLDRRHEPAPITIYKQSGKNLVPVKTLVPPASLIG